MRALFALILVQFLVQRSEAAEPAATPAAPDVVILRKDGRDAALQRVRALTEKPPGGMSGVEATIFHINDPVHESITLLAFQEVYDPAATMEEEAAWRYIRGIFWNDDPCGQLFDSWKNPSVGLSWFYDFRIAEMVSKGQKPPAWLPVTSCSLLGRSHYGELQFLHGMASSKGTLATDTQDLILAWAQFVWRVFLDENPKQKIGKYFQPRGTKGWEPILDVLSPDQTADTLFLPGTTKEKSATPRLAAVAVSSLLHMVQDSYAGGHVEREGTGEIRRFLTYTGQNHKMHGELDAWVKNTESLKLSERVDKLPGGTSSKKATIELLKLAKRKALWPEVEIVLREQIFKLAKNPAASDVGLDAPSQHQKPKK